MADEYEIVPEREVEDLKRDVDEIKKNPLGSSPAGRELVRSIKDLTDSVNHLIALFRDAADAMKLEEKESEAIGKKLSPMLDKFNVLIDQNEKIARGIVGVADLVRDDLSKKPSEIKPFYRPVESPSPAPMFSSPAAAESPPMPMFRVATPADQPSFSAPTAAIRPEPEIRPPMQTRMDTSKMDIPPPAAPRPAPRRLFGF